MKCSNCGYDNVAGANYCTQCNNFLGIEPAAATPESDAAAAPEAPVTPEASVAPSQPTEPAYAAAPSYSRSPASYNYQQPYSYQQPYYPYSYTPRDKQPFTITDAYIIIGFVLAIVGIFAYAFILLPASICFSVVGFVKRTNTRTLGLSIAGIVVGVVACLIKVGMVLNQLGVIPDWLSAGIFW